MSRRAACCSRRCGPPPRSNTSPWRQGAGTQTGENCAARRRGARHLRIQRKRPGEQGTAAAARSSADARYRVASGIALLKRAKWTTAEPARRSNHSSHATGPCRYRRHGPNRTRSAEVSDGGRRGRMSCRPMCRHGRDGGRGKTFWVGSRCTQGSPPGTTEFLVATFRIFSEKRPALLKCSDDAPFGRRNGEIMAAGKAPRSIYPGVLRGHALRDASECYVRGAGTLILIDPEGGGARAGDARQPGAQQPASWCKRDSSSRHATNSTSRPPRQSLPPQRAEGARARNRAPTTRCTRHAAFQGEGNRPSNRRFRGPSGGPCRR